MYRNKIAETYGNSVFNFLRNYKTVLKEAVLHSQRCMRVPISSHPCQHLLLFVFFNNRNPSGMKLYVAVLLICIFLRTKCHWASFYVLFSWLHIFFGEMSIQNFGHLKNWIICFLKNILLIMLLQLSGYFLPCIPLHPVSLSHHYSLTLVHVHGSYI